MVTDNSENVQTKIPVQLNPKENGQIIFLVWKVVNNPFNEETMSFWQRMRIEKKWWPIRIKQYKKKSKVKKMSKCNRKRIKKKKKQTHYKLYKKAWDEPEPIKILKHICLLIQKQKRKIFNVYDWQKTKKIKIK